jgi:ankyrin repeat protein
LRRSFATEPGEVNATNQTGETALRIAARHGQTNAADELIKLGGEWDAVSATLLGRTDALTAILSRRPAEATNFTGGKALLHLAAESGNIAAIEVLLSVGADLNARARSGLSPLGLALMRKQSEAADIFRSRGVSENIFDAVVLDLPDRAAALLAEDKSRGQIGNAFEFTPAHLAAALDRVQILKMLLDHRVPPDIAAGRLGVSPLHVAVACNRTNATALLLKRGAKVEVTDDAGCTPLHYATVRGSLEAVALLLQHGANPNTAIPSTSGTSPRVPPFARSTPGRTALHFATVSGQTNLIELLLKARANVNATDDLGRTPLDLACPDGQTAMWWMERPSSSPTARLTASFNSLGLPQLENLVPFRPLNSVSSRCPVLAAVLERAGGKPGNRR